MGICQCIAKSVQTPSAMSLEFTSYKDAYEGNGGSLKDYKLDEQPLGQGGFGTVWKAIHLSSGQYRAIKQINKSLTNEEEYQKILNEVKILKSLDHHNIIKIFDSFEENEQLYIVTELCTGGELFDKIIESNHFTEKDAAIAMKQILSALNYCHNAKIIHRDIKPENLLYDHNGEDSCLKIIDFGTSLKYTNQKLQERIGTVYYMAPELLEERYDEKCDMWSAGVVLYILLCGSPPFDGETDNQIIKRIVEGNIYFEQIQWKSVSGEAKDLVMKLLNKNPSKRLSAYKALSHPWIVKYTSEQVEAPQLKNVLTNMKHFRTSQKVQEAAFLFIVKQFITKEEKQELQRFFKFLDKNGDGVLTKQELLDGYKKIVSISEAELQVELIMEQVDKNQSGLIDYSEFVAATINKKRLLSQDILEQAFKSIDRDNSGAITVDELKQMFGAGNKIPNEAWNQLMEEVDKNGDGVLSLQEFKEMMLKLQID